jgi:HPr kinase/phosphorylase
MIEKMELTNLTQEIDISNIRIRQPDINRPALQLAGYFEHFEATRLQIIGFVEYTYMEGQSQEHMREIYEELFSYGIPAIVFCRELKPDPLFLKMALDHRIPLLSTKKTTSSFLAEIIRWLNVKLAPMIAVHGTLVDVFGEGLMITGESGLGKSDAAMELIKRGHRLVSDGMVELRRVSDDALVGSSPELTKYFVELRGIGVVDVKALFGASVVKDTQKVDLVIHMEEWNNDLEYEQLESKKEFVEYLGKKIECHHIFIRPGRNLAIICETAAVNHREKIMTMGSVKV